MLKSVLSRIIRLHIESARFCSSSSFKDKWPAKIAVMEMRNPVRLKRRPELFANIRSDRHYEHRHYEDKHNRRDHYIRRERDDYAQYPSHRTDTRHTRDARRSENVTDDRDFSKNDNDDYNERRGRERRRPLASQLLDEMNSSQEPSSEDQLFGGYSKQSKERLRELMGAERQKNYADGIDGNFIRLSHENRGPSSMHTYESKIERFCQKGRVSEAEEYFDKLVQEYRFKPTGFMYSNLIKAYAKKGDMKKCFSLYNKMKKMGLEPRNSHLYTSLFEVCLRFTSDNEHALEVATQLLGRIRHKSVQMSPITYNAAVKCFGMLGDIETAFQLADECPASGRNSTYMLSSLLIACSSNSTAGFQLALSVWRTLRKKKHIPLATKQYNLLLRTLYQGSGDIEQMRELIQHRLPPETKQIEQSSHGRLLTSASVKPDEVELTELSAPEQHVESETSVATTTTTGEGVHTVFHGVQVVSGSAGSSISVHPAATDTIPDILNSKLKLPADMTIRSLSTAPDRLILLGGVFGVLNRMKVHNCQPDIVTFFYLLRALPNTRECEDKLVHIMQEYRVFPDGDFYKYIFIRMIKRKSPGDIWELYCKTIENNITYDINAYSLLSEHCTASDSCQQILSDMKEHNVQPHLPILNSFLLRTDCTHFAQLQRLMEEMNRHSLQPDGKFFELLEHKFTTTRSMLVAQERNLKNKPMVPIDTEEMHKYSIFYTNWLEKMIEHQSTQDISTQHKQIL